MDDIFFLDVNIPMYAIGKDHPYQQACQYILYEITEENLQVAIDTEIIQEVLYRYSALQRWDTGTTMAVSLLQIIPTIFSVTRDDIEILVLLHKRYAHQGIKARDLIHAAVMQHHSLQKIISTDRHFDQIEGVIRIDPLDLYERIKT